MATVAYDKITVRFTENEVWELVLALKAEIRERMKDKHYETYPESWEQNTKPQMILFQTLAGCINRYLEYEQLLLEVQTQMEINKANKSAKENNGT